MNIEDIFPYPSFRVGQRELAQSVYSICKNGDRLVIEAMSGFGKTAPVLAGSILAAQENGARIIYACRTKRQVFHVMEELVKIQKRIPLQTAYLFSKSDYCLLKEMSRFPITQDSFKWYCSFNVTNNLCYYFLNLSLLNKEVTSLVKSFTTSTMPHSELLAESRKIHVCPYEVARLAMANSAIIVTTYHYLFDEASRSVLFANANASPSEMYAIVDEAHNVRDFVRDVNTSVLLYQELEQAIKDSRDLHLDRLASSLQSILQKLKSLASKHESWYVDKVEVAKLLSKDYDETWLPNLALELSACAGMGWESVATGKNLPSSITKVGSFIGDFVSSLQSDGKTLVKSDQGFFLVSTKPSDRFAHIVQDFASLALLSATINPTDLFLKSIGLNQKTLIHKVDLSRIFNVQTIIDTGVSSRFRSRDPEMYTKIAAKISAICESVTGGVGIFAPSYSMLDSLTQHIRDRIHGRTLLNEARNLSNFDADKIMQTFKSIPGSVLLAVQGGRFSEGEDFPGDQMDVSVVVGLPLPPPSPLMYAEYARTELTRHEAYLVISLLPALRKAIQSAGRHIRSPDKQAMVFFLDSRFNDREVMDIMPSWLKHNMLTGDFTPDEIKRIAGDFWSRGRYLEPHPS